MRLDAARTTGGGAERRHRLARDGCEPGRGTNEEERRQGEQRREDEERFGHRGLRLPKPILREKG
ncbi:MAG: hypothetical protein KatS3mg117_1438 [Geminicoccaceae bacterium]|nr:MAG: hypothetical protein KatS3mg117_1438 [Geminicoccaceae bacterium]